MFLFGLIALLAVYLRAAADLQSHGMAKEARSIKSSRQRNASALIAKPGQEDILSSKTRCCIIQRH